jgi:hypothetical protein
MGRHKAGFEMGNMRGVGLFAVIAVITIGVIMFLQMAGEQFGFTAAMSASLINVFPWVLVAMISIFILSVYGDNAAFFVGGFLGIGISMSFLLKAIHEEGYLTDMMMGGATIEIIMWWCFIICAIIGAAVGTAIIRKR